MPRIGGSSHIGRRPPGGRPEPLEFSPQAGLAQLNAVRRKYSLPPFHADGRLQHAAEKHARYMARTGQYGHELSPATRFPVRLEKAGFDGSAGENLGVGYGSLDEAIDGWLKSPKHRRILLRRGYDRAGVAYAFNVSGRNPRYTHFWVMIAGSG